MLMRLQRAEKGAVCGPSARSAGEAFEAGLDFSEVVVELRSRTQAVRGQTVPAEPRAGTRSSVVAWRTRIALPVLFKSMWLINLLLSFE